MFIGSFGKFQADTVTVIIALKAAGVSQLLSGLTNNFRGEIMDGILLITVNGNCASTRAVFSERHHTQIAVIGGKPGEVMQFKGK